MKHISIKATMSLAAILLLTAACTDELNDCPTDTGRVIAFTPSAESRAAVDGSVLPSGSSFSVWGWYGTEGDITKQVFKNEHETVSESNGKWTYTGGVQYWIPGNTYNFYGVYPAELPNVDVTNNGNITVTNFNCSATGDAAIDLMTATTATSDPNLSGDNPPEFVNLNFKHELARVNFIIASEGDAVNITNAQLYGISHIGSFTSNTLTGSGTWTLDPISNEDTPSFKTDNLDITDTQDHELFDGDLLLPPHSQLDGAMLTFQYQYEGDTESHTANIQLNKDSNINTWISSQRYNYRINIPLNSVDVTLTVTVTDWEEKNLTVEW